MTTQLLLESEESESQRMNRIHGEARDLIHKIEGDLYIVDLTKDLMIESLREIDFGAHILGNATLARH